MGADNGSERILYVIKADGAEETARAFDEVAAAMERTERLQKSMSDAQQLSAQNARIAGYRAEAAALEVLAAEEANASNQSRQFAAASGAASISTGNMREKISAAGGVLANLSSALGVLSPELAGVSSSFTLVGSSASQFLGVLSGVGAGAAVGGLAAGGGLIGAIYLSVKAMKDQAQAARELADYNKKVAESETEIAEANRKSYDDYLKRRLQKSIDGGYDTSQDDAAKDNAFRKRQQDLFLEQYNAQGGKSQAFDLGAAESPTAGPKQHKWDVNDTFAADQANRELLKKLDDAQFANEMKHFQEASDARLAQTQQSIQYRAEEQEFIDELHRKQLDYDEAEYESKMAGYEKIRAEQQKGLQGLTSLSALGASVTAKLISGAAEGQKQSSKAILRTIGEAMVGEGTRAIFSGIIDLASFNYVSGGIKLATGAAEIAAGIGFGAAAGPTPSAAGASAVSNPSPDQSPARDNGASSSPAPVQNVYIEFSSLTGPTAEDGVRIRDSLDKANNVYGRQV